MLLVFLFIFLWELLLASIREEKNNLSDGFKLKLIITYQLWFSVCLDKTYITENWKYWNKIIFKYINSDVKPICNENLVKKEIHKSRKQYIKPTSSAFTFVEL